MLTLSFGHEMNHNIKTMIMLFGYPIYMLRKAGLWLVSRILALMTMKYSLSYISNEQ